MSKETNNIALITNPTQNDIPTFLAQVNAKIKEIRGQVVEENKTADKHLDGFGKVKDIKTVEELVKAHASVVARQKLYNESATELGVDVKKYPFKLSGASASSWIDDIKSRMVTVKYKSELDKLNKIKKELEDNLSAEQKLQNSLQKISSLLVD